MLFVKNKTGPDTTREAHTHTYSQLHTPPPSLTDAHTLTLLLVSNLK